MTVRTWLAPLLAGILLVPSLLSSSTPACCPAPPSGKPVVNADQTVIMIWDAAAKRQHFIRQASFKSDADDFGFLVPTPSEPELEESGNEAFAFLRKVTEPAKKRMSRPSAGLSCACSAVKSAAAPAQEMVKVLTEKMVAGFDAVVLEADSADALTGWLKEHGYAYSPEIEAWAKPYVDAGWKITALKVAKGEDDDKKNVAASALRISFKTDRPLFPYREPDSKSSAEALGAHHRLLRIYFLADARYRGDLTQENPWTGEVAWSKKLDTENRMKLLGLLNLPEATGPAEYWLTEFEDNWPYAKAPADVYFSRDANQENVERDPVIEYVASPWPTDVTVYAIAAVVFLPPLLRRRRRGRGIASLSCSRD